MIAVEIKLEPIRGMAEVSDFKDAVRARVDRDPEFRRAIADQVSVCFRTGDAETAKAMARDYLRPGRGGRRGPIRA